MMKTDKEILEEYLELKGAMIHPSLHEPLILMIKKIREKEPRINSAEQLEDYCMICDDDDSLDDFYDDYDDVSPVR